MVLTSSSLLSNQRYRTQLLGVRPSVSLCGPSRQRCSSGMRRCGRTVAWHGEVERLGNGSKRFGKMEMVGTVRRRETGDGGDGNWRKGDGMD